MHRAGWDVAALPLAPHGACMIWFEDVRKSFKLRDGGERVVLNDCNAEFPQGSRIGILGNNGAGKSTLLKLIAGSEQPNHGRIIRNGRVSFPVGFTGTFHPLHSARENIKFLAHVYDMDFLEVSEWIEEFAELKEYFDMPIATYSSGMFARVAFATSFALDFDVYLVDEAIEVGDARFRQKCAHVFEQRMEKSSLVLVSQNIATIRQYCNQAAVLYDGHLVIYDSLGEAIDFYDQILRTV
jgi:capsular polysaccharide transport system ATP-binding protein